MVLTTRFVRRVFVIIVEIRGTLSETLASNNISLSALDPIECFLNSVLDGHPIHTRFLCFFVIKDCIFLPDLDQCIWDPIWEPHLSCAQAHARAHARMDTFCKLAAHECDDRCAHRPPSGYVRDCIVLDLLLVLTQQNVTRGKTSFVSVLLRFGPDSRCVCGVAP